MKEKFWVYWDDGLCHEVCEFDTTEEALDYCKRRSDWGDIRVIKGVEILVEDFKGGAT